MKKDFYAILGVGRDADDKQIRTAFRKLARKYHPDVNPTDPKAEAMFKQVSEAHEVLSDPDKRAAYDRFGSDWENPRAAEGSYGDFGGTTVDLGGIFGNLFGYGGASGFGRPGRPAHDIEQRIDVTLAEVDSGTKRTLRYQTEDACPTCRGTAWVITNQGREAACPNCRGTGGVLNSRQIQVTIPAGCEHDKVLRVSGGGAKGSQGKIGDLFVRVRVTPDSVFRRVGSDTEVDVEVPFTTATLGGEVRVPTPRGHASMRIPAGTQSGQKFRLKGQGVSTFGGGRGDLQARVSVTVPKTLSPEQRRLIDQLAALETPE